MWATDIGPECDRCEGTLYIYEPVEWSTSRWIADCVSCRRRTEFEGRPHVYDADGRNAAHVRDVRMWHVAFEGRRLLPAR